MSDLDKLEEMVEALDASIGMAVLRKGRVGKLIRLAPALITAAKRLAHVRMLFDRGYEIQPRSYAHQQIVGDLDALDALLAEMFPEPITFEELDDITSGQQ